MTTQPKTEKGQPSPTFADWLAAYGNGAIDDKLTAAFRDVAESVVLIGKSGAITLKIGLSAEGGGVVVSPKITVATPEVKESQFFYVAADGSLSRRDPKQPQLPGVETDD